MTVQEFKITHKRFSEALRYIITKEGELKKDPVKWERVKKNFFEKFEAPLDEAWQRLSKEEKKRLAPLYLFRKAAADETVKKVIDTFDAKIISIEENESPAD